MSSQETLEAVLCITLEGVNMSSMNWYGGANVFWQVDIPKITSSTTDAVGGELIWECIYRSERVMSFAWNQNSPKWKAARIRGLASGSSSSSSLQLTSFDRHKPIRFSFWDGEAAKTGQQHQQSSMGYFMTSVNQLLQSKQQTTKNQDGSWDLSKAMISKNDKGEEFGLIVVVDAEIRMVEKEEEHDKKVEKDEKQEEQLPLLNRAEVEKQRLLPSIDKKDHHYEEEEDETTTRTEDETEYFGGESERTFTTTTTTTSASTSCPSSVSSHLLALTLEGVDMVTSEVQVDDGLQLGFCDIFYCVERRKRQLQTLDGDQWETIYESETVECDDDDDTTTNAKWVPAFLDLNDLCGCSIDDGVSAGEDDDVIYTIAMEKSIRISFWDEHEDGGHESLGYILTTPAELLLLGGEGGRKQKHQHQRLSSNNTIQQRHSSLSNNALSVITKSSKSHDYDDDGSGRSCGGKVIVVDARIIS